MKQTIRKTFLATAFASLALGGLSGCAFTTETVQLSYVAQEGIKPVPGAEAIAVQVKVADERTDKTRISSKKNGFGMETAPILAAQDVTVTIRQAMERELHARGFQLAVHDPLVFIEAALGRFYNDHKMGFFATDAVAELDMHVQVRNLAGETVYSRHVRTEGKEENNQLMNGNNARLALDKALAAGMVQLFEDTAFIDALLRSSEPDTAGNEDKAIEAGSPS